MSLINVWMRADEFMQREDVSNDWQIEGGILGTMATSKRKAIFE